MWVIVYQPRQAARAALAHAYLWDRRDTSTNNPSSPESFTNRRTLVPKPPRAAFRLLYLNSFDTSRSNPSSPESFTNRKTLVRRPPASAFRFYYRPGADTSFSNPSSPESFVNLRTLVRRPPRSLLRGLYLDNPDTSASGDASDAAPADVWTQRRVRGAQRARFNTLYLFGNANDTPVTPPPSGAGTALWLRRRRRQQFLGRGKHGG